jgi:hypothetical protein
LNRSVHSGAPPGEHPFLARRASPLCAEVMLRDQVSYFFQQSHQFSSRLAPRSRFRRHTHRPVLCSQTGLRSAPQIYPRPS